MLLLFLTLPNLVTTNVINSTEVKNHSEEILTCDKSIYCNEDLLRVIQESEIYQDSRDFVEMSILEGIGPEIVLTDFNKIMSEWKGKPSRYAMLNFVEKHFQTTRILDTWEPEDHQPNPGFLNRITNQDVKKMAEKIVHMWKRKGSKVNKRVETSPEMHSILYIPNGFISVGGRFRDSYYWDNYWINRGLLISEMNQTVKGILENFCYLLKKYGHIPNSGRIYSLNRSQPPLFIKMIKDYIDTTDDLTWLRPNIPILEQELNFWINNKFTIINFNGIEYKLARYIAENDTPRPEAYKEDITNSKIYKSEEDKKKFYKEINSACESGWDFSSRWFFNSKENVYKNISYTEVTTIIPADLNGILYGAFSDLAELYALTGQLQNKTVWSKRAEELKIAINTILWDKGDGIWYDYDTKTNKLIKTFSCSNLVPLWMKVYDEDDKVLIGDKVTDYLIREEIVNYKGGIPATKCTSSSERWDYPNAHANLQYVVVHGLKNTENRRALELMRRFVENWIEACNIGFKSHGVFFDKYDALYPGTFGGGEYKRQTGYGWTNGVLLDFIELKWTSGSGTILFFNLRKMIFVACTLFTPRSSFGLYYMSKVANLGYLFYFFLKWITLKEKNSKYTPQDYYDVITQCRRYDKFILHEMKRENFVSTKIFKMRLKNTNGEQINWLQICWLRFLKNASYTILYKTSMKGTEFKTISLLPTRPGRPLKFGKIALTPLYQNVRPITYEKYEDIKQLLPYIPPVHHTYFETLPHAKHK